MSQVNGPAIIETPPRVNRLIHATSPYLLQHAHNPVDWYEWGPEALERARREDKPIFLSIGYSACHWCHVMERESFEDPQIAGILNEHFVCIKVDREERPDLDGVYMNATLLANRGQGGWPMSLFLTPEGRPFFAGTYFPPRPAYGRPGLKELLERVIMGWQSDRQRVQAFAANLTEAVREFSTVAPSEELIPEQAVTHAVDHLAAAFDRSTGGLLSGATNKFPPSMAMSLMLRVYHHSEADGAPRRDLLELVELTLDHMAGGGIHDHLGGGFFRYSTDPQWLVPHFEKMLYDQALVSSIYVEAFQLTGRQHYADVARRTCNYVLSDLLSPEGGFYSARDADSEGQEGKYYVWSKEEVMRVLGPQLGPIFCSYYDMTDEGNWEGRSILNVQRDADTVARLHNLPLPDVERMLEEGRARLLTERQKRIPPALDDKVLAAWNGLMIASLARAARVLPEPAYAEAAARAAHFVLTGLADRGRLLRTWRQGRAHTPAFLDDYAFMIEALLELYETTFEHRWLGEAERLTNDMIHYFWDNAAGGFFYSAADAEQLLVRTKEIRDGAIPASSSVALMDLLRVQVILGRSDLRDRIADTLRALASSVQHSPLGFERLLAAVDFYYSPLTEVVLVGLGRDAATQALIRLVRQVYDPCRVVLLLDPMAEDAAAWRGRIPALAGKAMLEGKPAAYVCRNRLCRQPTTDPQELLRALRAG